MVSILPCVSASALIAITCLGCASTPAAPSTPAPAQSPITAGQTTVVVAPAASAPGQTLPEFLGITGLLRAGGGAVHCGRNALGKYFPGVEAKPAPRAISDPANLDSPSPAVAAAADVKAQEDGAAQKVKGIRYLASVGCSGCYPDVEKALLASLDDCTEEVRYEGVKALREAAGDPCARCQQDSCCSPEVRKKLREIAYEIDEKTNCFKEPSARVRRVARLALANCGGPVPQGGLPEEGPDANDQPGTTPSPPEEHTALTGTLER